MKPKTLYDISPLISPRLAVFPGDRPFARDVALSFAGGDHLELSSFSGTVHLGAHADAPSHYGAGAPAIDRRPLGPYLGLAQVMRVGPLPPKARVGREHLTGLVRAPRILFRTNSFPDPEAWRGDFNSLSPDLLTELADQGVRLVGIDTPSVDPADAKVLESHQILLRRDLSVLEGLVLSDVPDGLYTLIALPLPLEGMDASPVRAVLLPVIEGFPERV